MNSRLNEFVSYVNTNYEKIDAMKQSFFKKYFSKVSNVNKLNDNDVHKIEFLKKVDAKVDNLQKIQESEINEFFNELLFEVNVDNIMLYCLKHKKNNYRFSCFMDNEKVFRYIAQDSESFNAFMNVFTSNAEGNFCEDPKFLLLLMYTPDLKKTYYPFFINNIVDGSIDYTDVFSMIKPWSSYVDIQMYNDSVCELLIENNKLKRTWNNLIFSYRQLDENEKLINYINGIGQKGDDGFYGDLAIHNGLINWSKNFVLFLFENKKINSFVLDLFIKLVRGLSVPDIIQEKIIDNEDYEIEKKYTEWNREKCLYVLQCFFNVSFHTNIRYSKLISYLMKNDLERNLNQLDNPIIMKFRGINPTSRLICIYASILYSSFDINDRKSLFNKDEMQSVLNKINLSDIDSIFSEWENCLDKDEVSKLVNSILLNEKIIFEKFLQNRKTTLILLEELIGIADPLWMEKALSYMDSCDFFDREEYSENENEKMQMRFDQYRERLYKYIYSSNGNKNNDQKIIDELLKKIDLDKKELDYLRQNIEISNLNKRIERLKSKLKFLHKEYDCKKIYISLEKQQSMDKLYNTFNHLADNIMQYYTYSVDILKYQNEDNSIKIQEYKDKMFILKHEYDKYNGVFSQWHFVVKSNLNFETK